MSKPWSIFIALALSLGLYHELRLCAFSRLEDGNDLPMYMAATAAGLGESSEVPENWKSRAVGCDLAGYWFRLWGGAVPNIVSNYVPNRSTVTWNPSIQNKDCALLGSYHALWFFATCLVLIAFLENPLIPMLGTFVSILTCSPSFFCPYLMPWDLPTMAVWTLIFLLYDRFRKSPAHPQKWLWLGLIIAFGGLLKETILVEALFLFAAPWPWIRRVAMIVLVVVVSQVLNWLICGARPDWMFAVRGIDVPGQSHWNPFSLWPVLFANGGAMMLLPWMLFRRRDRVLALTCGAFITLNAATFLNTGYFDELRDWLELAPLGWCLIAASGFTITTTTTTLKPQKKNKKTSKS